MELYRDNNERELELFHIDRMVEFLTNDIDLDDNILKRQLIKFL